MSNETHDFGDETKVEDYGDELIKVEKVVKIERDVIEVTPRDIFKLGKVILAVCAVLFVFVACIRIIYGENKGAAVADIWDYSKTILNSITSLVLGLYFGSRSK